MAIQLSTPVTVRVGVAQATCTHAQFRAMSMNGNTTPMTTHVVLGVVQPATTETPERFCPVEGVCPDGSRSTVDADWTQDDYDWLAGKPQVAAAVSLMKARHDWIIGGRAVGAAPE